MAPGKGKGKGKPAGKPQKVVSQKPVKSHGAQNKKATANSGKVLKKGAIDREISESEDSSSEDVEKPLKPLPPGEPLEVSEQSWALTPVTNAKKDYTIPDWWGKGALHHKISKAKLSAIAEALHTSCYGSDTEEAAAALKFWYLCCDLAGDRICQAVGQAAMGGALNPVRLLWNIPIMYSLGPQSPATDPGQGFDPDTEPIPDGNGFRRLTEVSAKLARLEKVWDTADEAEKRDALMWQRMHILLSEAHEAGKRTGRGTKLLYPPLEEQWLHDVTPTTDTVIRKGLVRFLGKDVGKMLFLAARSREDITIHDGATWVVENSYEFILEDRRTELVVSADVKTLQHICERHTLTFFPFKGNSARPINTFWLGTATFLGVRYMLKHVLLPSVARGCVRELQRVGSDEIGKGVEIELGQVSNGVYGTIYFRANAEPLRGDTVLAEVKTIAPDGPQALGFLRSELLAIGSYMKYVEALENTKPVMAINT